MPRVLVTRASHQASELAERLRALGAEPITIPVIEIVAPSSFGPLDAAIARLFAPEDLSPFHWLVFTSANAVEAFQQRLQALEGTAPGLVSLEHDGQRSSVPNGPGSALVRQPLLPASCRIAAIGRGTVRTLEAIGLSVDLRPRQAVAESFAEALVPHALQPGGSPSRFLLIRAESGGDTPPRETLPEALRAAGAEVTIAPAYRTLTPPGSIDALRVLFRDSSTVPDAITFTSPSTARNLFAMLEAANIYIPFGAPRIEMYEDEHGRFCENVTFPHTPILASIGPITSATLRGLNHPPDVEALESNVSSLADSLMLYLHLRKRI